MLPGSLSLTTPLAYEVKEDWLQERIQAAASEPDSPNVFEAAFTRPPPDIVLDYLYDKCPGKLEFVAFSAFFCHI